MNANMSQNSNTKSVNLTLPTFQGSIDRVFPFEPRDRPKKGILQNINLQYSTRAENRIITTEENLFTSKMFELNKKKPTFNSLENEKLFRFNNFDSTNLATSKFKPFHSKV